MTSDDTGRREAAGQIPETVLVYLRSPSLQQVWAQARRRLERNEAHVTGTVLVDLDEAGVDLLAGLGLPGPAPGRVRVRLDKLDSSLRSSAAAAGLVSVLEALDGPIVDQRAALRDGAAAAASVWVDFENELAVRGLASADWVPDWLDGIRRAGLLTRAGPTAGDLARQAAAVVTDLAPALPAETDSHRELATIASRHTGTSHGLDDGTLLANLVLRAVAAATGSSPPASAADRRELWTRAGVNPDLVSGTLLVWALRPDGDGAWAAMMWARADLGLVTHVTLQEWRAAAATESWVSPGTRVWVCENPQVLQAAAAAGVRVPLLCTSGSPATVATAALEMLLASGVEVRYHGDLDVAGVKLAARLYRRGVRPWRMSAGDYLAAVAEHFEIGLVPLSGHVPETPWDPPLAAAMRRTRLGVHEELVIECLLEDLRVVEPPPPDV